jgi:hypothetical protein
MTTATIQSTAAKLRAPGVEFEFDEAQLAAVSFLARYRSSTAAVSIARRTRDANAPTVLGLRWPQDDRLLRDQPGILRRVDDLDPHRCRVAANTDEGGWHGFGGMTEHATKFDDSTVDTPGRLT